MSSSQSGEQNQNEQSRRQEEALRDLEQEVQRLKETGVKGDLNAILQRIAQLHEQNERLKAENTQKDQRIGQLQLKTQGEMTKQFEQMMPYIDGLEGLTPEAKEKVKNGLSDLIKLSAEGSGVWQVMCCASAAHANNINRIEQLQREATELREKIGGGVFGDSKNRYDSSEDNGKKRKHDVIAADEKKVELGVWDDFEVMLKRENGIAVE